MPLPRQGDAVLLSLDLPQGASGEDCAAVPRDSNGRDANASPGFRRHCVGRVRTGGIEDTQRRHRVVAVELAIGGEDVPGGVEDGDEGRETDGHIDLG